MGLGYGQKPRAWADFAPLTRRVKELAMPAPSPASQPLPDIGPNGRTSYSGSLGDEYDPKAFYVRSIDAHGHSASPRIKLHPDTAAEISRLLASGVLAGTPLDSFSTFVRDAVVHQLHRISELVDTPWVTELARLERQMAAMDGRERERLRRVEMVNNARTYISNSMQDNDVLAVQDFIEGYEGLLDVTPEPHRSHIEQSLTTARNWLKSHT